MALQSLQNLCIFTEETATHQKSPELHVQIRNHVMHHAHTTDGPFSLDGVYATTNMVRNDRLKARYLIGSRGVTGVDGLKASWAVRLVDADELDVNEERLVNLVSLGRKYEVEGAHPGEGAWFGTDGAMVRIRQYALFFVANHWIPDVRSEYELAHPPLAHSLNACGQRFRFTADQETKPSSSAGITVLRPMTNLS